MESCTDMDALHTPRFARVPDRIVSYGRTTEGDGSRGETYTMRRGPIRERIVRRLAAARTIRSHDRSTIVA
jgi:hypothetical protein